MAHSIARLLLMPPPLLQHAVHAVCTIALAARTADLHCTTTMVASHPQQQQQLLQLP